MSKSWETMQKEFVKRFDLIEYRALQIVFTAGSTEAKLYAMMILQTLNPKSDYRDINFCQARKDELEHMYFDEWGGFKE